MGNTDFRQKIVHIELLRIISILMVMFMHSGTRGHDVYRFTDGRVTFTTSVMLASLCEVGVTIFWMISGAVLLGKKESASDCYKKRLPRIIFILVLFSLIRYFYNYFAGLSDALSITDFLKKLYSDSVFMPYWFLYYYVGVILLLPFLRILISNMNRGMWTLFIALAAVFLCVIPVINVLLERQLEVPFLFTETVTALMLGYAAENVLQKEWLSKKSVIAMFCLFAIAIVTIESLLTVSAIRASSDATFFDLLGIPLAFCIFAAFRGIALNIKSGNPFFEKAVIFLGSCTFGVYLLEDYSRNLLSFICDMLADKLTLIPACLIWLLCSYLLTVIVVAIIKKTPILRKIGV